MVSISRHVFLLLALIGFMISLPVTSVWSADEDVGSSVYLVFDPETGEFVTEHDPDVVERDRLDYELGRASGVIDLTPPPKPAVMSTSETAEDSGIADVGATSSAIWIGSIIALGLLGGILVFRKKS